MPLSNDLTLTVDLANRRLIRDIFSDVQILPPRLVQGDTYNVRILAANPRAVRDPRRVYDLVTLPTDAFVGIGPVGQPPELGTFVLTWDGDTTAPIAYNATAATVASALNALASVTTAGGVTVTGDAGGPYQVQFTTAGARDQIIGDGANLFPISVVTVYDARIGTAELTAIQLIALDRQPAALASSFTALPAAQGSVTELQETPLVQRVSIDPAAYAGSFTLTVDDETTGAIPFDVDAGTLAATINDLDGISGAIVIGQFPEWDVSGLTDAITVDVTGLIVPVGIEGELTLATAGIEQLVGRSASELTKIEISVIDGGNHVTLAQADCFVLNDNIVNAPISGPSFAGVLIKLSEDGNWLEFSTGGQTYQVPAVPKP